MSTTAIEDIYELTPLQQGLLFHCLSVREPDMYVAQRGYRLHGALDHDALDKAWRDVVARHPALRTTFHWDDLDKPLQVVHRDASVTLDVLDWRDAEPAAQQARLRRCLDDDRLAGFDLAVAPLMRLTLVRLADERYEFVWTHHMIALDGWSVPLVIGEIFTRYGELTSSSSGPGRAPHPAPPFREYVAWLQGQDEGAAERFWRNTLAGAVPTTLAARAARPDRGGDVRAEELRLTAEETRALQETAARHRVTLNTVVQAAWALLLARHTGTDDVVFGMTTSGRPPALSGVEAMVGLFINTLPLRVPVPAGAAPVGVWLRDVQERQTAVREYEYSSLAQIRSWSGLPGGRRLFDTLVVFESYPVPRQVRAAAGELRITTDSSVEKTGEPLTVIASASPDLTVRLLYQVELFDPGLVAALADQFGTVLRHLADGADGAVEDIPLIGADAYLARSAGWNDTARRYPGPATLHGLVEEQVHRSPDAVAVRADGVELPYAELDARAARLAAVLRRHGAGPDAPVGVCADRCAGLVVALLAALKAGAAYLPLDPGLPPARRDMMLRDVGAAVVLADRPITAGPPVLPLPTDGTLPDGAVPDGAVPAVRDTDDAYVIYTSGSTGVPKGVPITHRAIRNRLLWMQEAFSLGPGEAVLQKTPFDFDVSVWEFFWPLTVGARLVLAAPGGHRDPAYLARVIADEGITTVHFVPSMLRHFLDEPRARELGGLRRVICSGEALSWELKERCLAELPHAGLYNLYGPTEAAVDVTWWDCREPAAEGVVPIGRPVANTRIHLLDGRGRPVPPGVPGELCIGGLQVTAGYLNRPDLDASAFRDDPFGDAVPGGARLYRSGDLARRRPDGALEFLGRLDHQVKVHGFRIEPGEVEHALTRHPRVTAAVVVARPADDGSGDARLVAYPVAGRPHPEPAELRAHLAELLPAHLVPSAFVVLDALPVTVKGKLDRAALPAPQAAAPSDAADDVPRGELEERVAAVFADVLGVASVGREQGFFDLGGDSFRAIRAVRALPGADVGLLFRHPTVRGLAEALRDPGAGERDAGTLLDLTPDRPDARRTLVCVPYGGGAAIAYHPLARHLPADVAVRAVRLPGHDLGAVGDLQPLADVAEAAVREVLATVTGPLALYGHCIGVALTVEMALRLERAGRRVERVFLGGTFPFPFRQVFGVELARLNPFRRWETDERTMRYLQSLGGFEELVEPGELAQVMAAFRHDGRCARRWFTDRYAETEPPRLRAPITFVAGDADPETRHYQRRHRQWDRFGEVGLAVIPEGGHYFLKHQAADLAAVVRQGW